MSAIKRMSVTAVYAVGTLMTAVLLCMFLSPSDFVPYPDAMLPAPLWQLATEWLAVGTLPMAAASRLFDRAFAAQRRRIRLLIYAPAIICACFGIFWIAVWGIAILKMIFHGMA